jgi:hypothetical protein
MDNTLKQKLKKIHIVVDVESNGPIPNKYEMTSCCC